MKTYYIYSLYLLCASVFAYSCEKEPKRLTHLIYFETQIFPPLQGPPPINKVYVSASPLVRISKPLVYETSINSVTTINDSQDSSICYGFKPDMEIESVSKVVTRQLYALKFVGEIKPITFPIEAIKKPYYIVLPFFSNEEIHFKPVHSD